MFSFPANNSGISKRQITDLVDQSIQINTHCFVVTADNRYILACGFWDKSFRVYSSETGACVFCDFMPFVCQLVHIKDFLSLLQIKCLCAHMLICSLFIQGNSLRSCLVTGMWWPVLRDPSPTLEVIATLSLAHEMQPFCCGTGADDTTSSETIPTTVRTMFLNQMTWFIRVLLSFT